MKEMKHHQPLNSAEVEMMFSPPLHLLSSHWLHCNDPHIYHDVPLVSGGEKSDAFVPIKQKKTRIFKMFTFV